MNPITILLAEDHLIVREGLRKLLSLDAGLEVVGEAEDGRQAVALAGQLKPAVVLMDIAMPALNGLDATRQIVKAHPDIRVLMLSAHSEDAYVSNATEAGAVGFLLKHSSVLEVCEAVRAVVQGKTWFTRAITRRFERRGPKPQAGAPVHAPIRLTVREAEVLQLVAEGNGNKTMASILGIGIKTVEKHREHLMAKLDIHDTAGLTRYAISSGVIESAVQPTVMS
jgi:DNA-binding NarL/FixJ family response regulator